MGGVYIFGKNNNLWLESQFIIGSDTIYGDMFGISISTENNYLVVGSRHIVNNNRGQIYIYIHNELESIISNNIYMIYAFYFFYCNLY